MNYNLSICIPTKRSIEASRNSISSAIGFCDSTSSELIVSDNSSDKSKSEMWKKIPLPFMKYMEDHKNEFSNWVDNWLNGINNCSGKFIGIVSDDDVIVDLDKSAVNYNELLKPNISGIKPVISLWNAETGIYKINNFNIDANTALERVQQYNVKASGNNTTYFSFFKNEVIKDIFNIIKYHPTKGGYLDWPIVMACVSSGKILIDSSKLLIYKNNNWFGDQQYIAKQVRDLYVKCGLGEEGVFYSSLMNALDSFILIMRKNSKIALDDKLDAAEFVLNSNVMRFINSTKTSYADKYPTATKKEIDKLNINSNIENKLNCCLEIIASAYPELKSSYKVFYEKSVGLEWTNFI